MIPASLVTVLSVQVVPTVLAVSKRDADSSSASFSLSETVSSDDVAVKEIGERVSGGLKGKVEGAIVAEVTALVAALAAGQAAPTQLAPTPLPLTGEKAKNTTASPSPSLSPSLSPYPTEETQEEAFARIKTLVSTKSPLLFMKGSPGAEQCGFSRKTVALLETKIERGKYETHDILQDPSLRKFIKIYANWPTFPQLWVGGELVGGLDILKEMEEEGELEGVLGVSK